MHRSRVALACMAVVVMMALLIPLVGCGGGGPTVPCKISSVSGDVQILRSGSTESVKATNDMELGVGDTITTGSDESANLIFFDGSHMEIKANSEILVKELSTASTGSTSVSLRQNIGRTINRVNKLIDSGSRYEVETPSGVTLVKGTIFEVLVLQSGDTTVKAEEGSVSFTASEVTVTVNQGFQSSASVGGTPSTPSAMATTTPTPTATATTAETPASTPTISSTPTATVTPAETLASITTPTSTQPTPNGALPQELIGVWKSDCGVHSVNQYRTIVWTLEGSMLQMVYDVWDSDSSCSDPSKKLEHFVMTWESDLATQNTDGSYKVTATLTAETAAYLAEKWVTVANDMNFYEYNDWQVGISKDVSGKIREPGASPELDKGTQSDLLLKVDGDKLSIDVPGLSGIIYTKQSTMPQELIGIWKSDCGVHVGNPFGTIAWTIEDSMLRMVYTVWNDPSCIDSSKKFEDFVMTWEPNLVTQNTDGSYTVTATLVAETAAYLTEDGVALANDMNFYEYNDWQAGISKDVSGKIREPGASPEPNRGTQSDLLLKLDGDKLSIDIPGLSGIIYTKQ